MGDKMSSTPIRTTQRAPRSCTECSRRKVKCNQKIPCQPCLARKVAHKCARPVVRVHGEVTVAIDIESAQDGPGAGTEVLELVRENSLLRERIARLETRLALGTTASPSPSSPFLGSESGAGSVVAPPSEGSTDVGLRGEERKQLDNHIVTVEIINFTGVRNLEGHSHPRGRGQDQGPGQILASSSPDGNALRISENPTQTIPSKGLSDVVILFSLRTLGFIHCAVRANVFYAEYQEFWKRLSRGDASGTKNHHWMAVYHALLTTGLYFIDIEDLSTNHHLEIQQRCNTHNSNNLKENKTHLARIWYDACLRELERANFTAKASLRTVQSIIILTLCNLNFGEMERESLLHGLAVNVARYLGMHRLGSEEKYPLELAMRPVWSTAEDRQLGRRLWWTLVICDWLGCWSRSPSIYPESFDCHLTRSAFDHEILLDATPSTEAMSPSPLDYHLVMVKFAYIVFTRFKAKRDDGVSDSLSTALTELDEIYRSSALWGVNNDAPSANSFETAPHWSTFPRYLLSQVVEYLRMSLAQLFLFRALETSQDERLARTQAVRSAELILRARFQRSPGYFQSSWVISAATAASGILLMIDHLCFQTQKDTTQTAYHLGLISQCLTIIDGLKSNSEVFHRLLALGHLFKHANNVRQLPADRSGIVKYVISQILSPPVEGVSVSASVSDGHPLNSALKDVSPCTDGRTDGSNVFSFSPADSGLGTSSIPTVDPFGWPDDGQGWLDELLPGAFELDQMGFYDLSYVG